ncbi:hypothetical protein [Methylobacterium isbiliense]|uniref:hypothetical protein n=1 Tax=Methylobacterium isbiliense TaxID=315478 RepID=UPI003F492756
MNAHHRRSGGRTGQEEAARGDRASAGSAARQGVEVAGVADAARAADIALRGYVSCVLGCPHEGSVAPEA